MRIAGLTQALNVENIKKLEQERKNVEKSSKVVRGDSSHISKDGKRLQEAGADIDIVKTRAAYEPEIRMDKVNEVREKIKNGYYDSPEFVDKLAEKMAKQFGA